MKRNYLILGLITILILFETSTAFSKQQDIVFVLDNSGSMHENDPDILTKSMVSTFIKQLEDTDRVGIVIFDESARLAVPLTRLETPASRQKLFKSLDQIDYLGQLTNTPAAIERAIYELRTSSRDDTQRSIVFLTDGIIDTGDPRRDADMTKWLIENLTAECADLEIKIFGVAFTENADFHLIQSLVAKTNGAYFRSFKAGDISNAFQEIITMLTAETDSPSEVVQESIEPLNSVEPIESAETLKSVDSWDMASQSNKISRNITTVKIYENQSDSLVSTLLRNFFRIIVTIVAIGILCLPLYLFFKQKKTRPEKLISPESNDNDKFSTIQPEAQLLGLYENDKEDSNPNILYLLDKSKTTIGRAAQNEIVIPKSTVSNFHAIIQFVNGQFQIEDNQSTNGTYLADNRLPPKEPVQLKHGDIVKFATFDFRFLLSDSTPSSEETIMMTECLKIRLKN